MPPAFPITFWESGKERVPEMPYAYEELCDTVGDDVAELF